MLGSLRTRLLVGIGGATTLTLIVAMTTLYLQTQRSMLREFDETLGARARALGALVEQTGEGAIELDFADHPMQEYARKIRPEYFQVRDEDGQTLARSPRLGDADLPAVRGTFTTLSGTEITLPDGRPGRMVCVRFLPHIDGDQLGVPVADDDDQMQAVAGPRRRAIDLAVAAGTEDLLAALSHQGWLLLSVSGGALITLLAALAFVVARSLRPLRLLAEQISDLNEDTLQRTLHVPNAPAEVVPLISRLNELMGRLRAAFIREKTMSSDVAHELRTPVSGLRSTLEVTLAHPRSVAEYRSAVEECFAICDETQRLVETLLSMARVESGTERTELRLVDLWLLVTGAWKAFESRARERDLKVDFEPAEGVFVNTDPERLRLILSNVFDNAASYADNSGRIRIALKVAQGACVVSVSNTGCELNEIQLLRIFDRFWRADRARSQTGAHSGLGLALARKTAASLGLGLTAATNAGIFTIEVSFPAAVTELVEVPTRENTQLQPS